MPIRRGKVLARRGIVVQLRMIIRVSSIIGVSSPREKSVSVVWVVFHMCRVCVGTLRSRVKEKNLVVDDDIH